jgi:hypothetical protein
MVIEARMLFKIKPVRCDLRKFLRLAQPLIILNLNKLIVERERGRRNATIATFKVGMLLKTNEA